MKTPKLITITAFCLTTATSALLAADPSPAGSDSSMKMMNHTDGWMSGWMGGGMWIWTVIGVLVVVLLVVVINKLSKK